MTTYSAGPDAGPMRVPNYPALDSAGNLYVADSGEWNGHNGRILKIALGGRAEVWTRELRDFPNGLCMGPGESHLYAAMSLNPQGS